MPIRSLLLLLLCLAGTPAWAAGTTPPELLLANEYDGDVAVADYWVSEKLDGVRGYWTGERLITRGGHPVNPPDWFTAGWPEIPMDGELWLGRGRFAEVSGIVRTHRPVDAEWRSVRFMVFDLPALERPFSQRVSRMREMLRESGIAWLRPVAQFRVADADRLDERLAAVVEAGGEGLMLHRADAMPVTGRSDAVLKYKPFDDAEARVVGHTQGKGKYAGLLGALVVERPDGLRFRIGTGFSEAERADPPPIGSRITYRYNGLTANGIPRFARFLRIRPRPGGRAEPGQE